MNWQLRKDAETFSTEHRSCTDPTPILRRSKCASLVHQLCTPKPQLFCWKSWCTPCTTVHTRCTCGAPSAQDPFLSLSLSFEHDTCSFGSCLFRTELSTATWALSRRFAPSQKGSVLHTMTMSHSVVRSFSSAPFPFLSGLSSWQWLVSGFVRDREPPLLYKSRTFTDRCRYRSSFPAFPPAYFRTSTHQLFSFLFLSLSPPPPPLCVCVCVCLSPPFPEHEMLVQVTHDLRRI